MNSNRLDELLSSFFRRSLPAPTDQLPAAVWAEIRRRRRRSLWSRLTFMADWRECLATPAVLGTACALALAIGVLAPAIARPAPARLARESLHFEVFSASRSSFIDRIANRPFGLPTSPKP